MNIDDLPLFKETSADFRAQIEPFFQWRSFSTGREIINRADPNTDVLFVCHGKVRVVIYTLNGREVSLDDVGAGSFFGEIAAIDSEPRSASVVALEPSEIAFLSAEKFRECLRKETCVTLRVMQRMSTIIRQANDRIIELSTLCANDRIYAEILRLALKYGVEKEEKIYISPAPVHSDIAARISTARETVARAMSSLSKRKIVTRESGALIVQDIKKLSDIVQKVRGDSLL